METFDFTLRLSIAWLFGAAIGLEREWRQKSAGLRTNTLVSTGAAAYILLSVSLTGSNGDPSRVASQIVTGIGFLGAGVIMKDGLNVQGLNTAATIWCSAAVGALCGVGLFIEGVIVTIMIMLTHVVLRPVGIQLSRITFVKSVSIQTDYLIIIRCRAEVENHIRVLLMQMLTSNEQLLLRSLSSDEHERSSNVVITAVISAATAQDSLMERVASRLTIEDKVTRVSWEIAGTQSDL